MIAKKLFIYFLLLFLSSNFVKTEEIKIISKVDDKIITNIDIRIEKKYLLLIDNNLNKLSEKEFFNLAKNSLIREIIKKKEVERLYLKQSKEIENRIIEDFYKRLGFDDKKQFKNYLDKKNINLVNMKKKLLIEAMWNQIIFNKFANQVKIDKKSLEEDIINYYNSKDKKYEYNLSEILIDVEKDINTSKEEIYKFIEEFGFNIAANKFSKSDTSKFGGKIGWIKSSRLSETIKNKISQIKIGEVTEPIQSSSGYLFLKLNDKKEIVEKIDLEKEIKQQTMFERNRQLKLFSFIYYKKLKKNTNIYENR